MKKNTQELTTSPAYMEFLSRHHKVVNGECWTVAGAERKKKCNVEFRVHVRDCRWARTRNRCEGMRRCAKGFLSQFREMDGKLSAFLFVTWGPHMWEREQNSFIKSADQEESWQSSSSERRNLFVQIIGLTQLKDFHVRNEPVFHFYGPLHLLSAVNSSQLSEGLSRSRES